MLLPITSVGRIFGSIIIILGIGTVALFWYFSTAFSDFQRRNQKKYEDKLKDMLSDNIIDDQERRRVKETFRES